MKFDKTNKVFKMKYVYPSLHSFDLEIAISKKEYIRSFYKKVDIIVDNTMKGIKNPYDMIGLYPKDKHSQWYRIYSEKLGITVVYPKKWIKYPEFNDELIDVKLENIRPINLYKNAKYPTAVRGINQTNIEYYDKLYGVSEDNRNERLEVLRDFIYSLFGSKIASWLITKDYKLNLNRIMVTNISFVANTYFEAYHRFYIGFNREIGERERYYHTSNSTRNVGYMTEFTDVNMNDYDRHDILYAMNIKRSTIGVYHVGEYLKAAGTDSIKKYFGSDYRDRIVKLFYSAEESPYMLDDCIQIVVQYDSILDIEDYQIRSLDYDGKSTVLSNLLNGDYNCYTAMVRKVSRVFGNSNTMIVDINNKPAEIGRIMIESEFDSVRRINLKHQGDYYIDIYYKKLKFPNDYDDDRIDPHDIVSKLPIIRFIESPPEEHELRLR